MSRSIRLTFQAYRSEQLSRFFSRRRTAEPLASITHSDEDVLQGGETEKRANQLERPSEAAATDLMRWKTVQALAAKSDFTAVRNERAADEIEKGRLP